jgi:hypothetical protein
MADEQKISEENIAEKLETVEAAEKTAEECKGEQQEI